jgi:chromosome segregation ATPase
MATTKKTATRPAVKRSRADVEKEFAEVRTQVEEAREEASPKLDALAKLRETEVRQAVAGISVETVVQRLSELGLDVSKALNNLSEQLVGEVSRLIAVREAIEVEKKDLEKVHQLEIAATALDQMVQDYARQKSELEEEIAGQRERWEEETRSAERDRKEQEEALRKQRQRELEDFEYKKALERKKAQDKYDEELRLTEKKNQEKQEALEKSWQQREAALREREDDVAKLRKEAEEFPKQLKAEVDRAAAEATRQTEARLEQRIVVLQKDAEIEKRMADLRVQTLEGTVAQMTAQITALQKQLDDAKKQVQDIAVKAIEGASGARALTHINEIAIEQAKHRSPQG